MLPVKLNLFVCRIRRDCRMSTNLLSRFLRTIRAATWENRIFAYAKTKTAKLISAFVFATWIVQPLCFLNLKFQASSHLLWLYSPVFCRTWSETPKTCFLTPRLISSGCICNARKRFYLYPYHEKGTNKNMFLSILVLYVFELRWWQLAFE